MPAYNSITGKAIITNPINSAYSDGWDLIYAKKSAHDWLKSMPEIQITDPDGWKYDDGVTLDTHIKYSDFCKRLNESKIINI